MGLRDKIKQNLGTSMPPMISRMGNNFTLRDAAGNERPPVNSLDVIIVDGNASVSKMYRENKTFNPNDPTPPDCFSDNGTAPSSYALKPQNDVCVTCPHNARGSEISRVSGAMIKACSDNQKLAVFVVGDDQNILYQLVVTPGSLSNFRQYMKTLEGHNYDPEEVVTRLAFDRKQVGVLTFEPAEVAPDEYKQLVADVAGTPQARWVTGEDDTPRLGALPKPDAHQAIGLPQAEAALRQQASPDRQISSGQETRQETRQEATGPTREQLEATLVAQRAGREPAKRGRPPKAAETLPPERSNVTEIPAFLSRAGMAEARALPAEVETLLPAKQANPLGDRLANAFKLPLRS